MAKLNYKKRKRPPLLLIEWVDSCGRGGWDSSAPAVSLIESIGFIVAKCDESISLSISQNQHPEQCRWGACITIPRVAINRTRRVKVG